MSVAYKCIFCKKYFKTLPERKVRIYQTVPGAREGDVCYVTDHVCDRCYDFYKTYVENAEYEAAYILMRGEDPVGDLIKSMQEEMPTNCDGAWDLIVPHDQLSNKILDSRRIIWQEGLDQPMTIGEVVRYQMEKEKEAEASENEFITKREDT